MSNNNGISLNKSSIEIEIEKYLNSKETTGGLLLTGPWGSGKTYFINELLGNKASDKYAVSFVSLFGINNIKELHKQVKEKYLYLNVGELGEKVISALRSCGKAISKLSDKLADISESTASSLAWEGLSSAFSINYFDFIQVTNEIKQSDGSSIPFVIVFDDFERCKIDIIDRMGAINYYIESLGIKTIILCDEKRIKSDDFQEMKEKLISRTIKLNISSESILKSISESFSTNNQEYKDFLNKNIEEFKNAFSDSNCYNFRLYKCCLADYERIFETWNNESNLNIDDAKDYIYVFCANKLYRSLGQTKVEAAKMFRKGSLEEWFESIRVWQESGEWNPKIFINELLNRYHYTSMTPGYKISHLSIYDLEQSDFETGLPIVLGDAYNGNLPIESLVKLLTNLAIIESEDIKLTSKIDYKKIKKGIEIRYNRVLKEEVEETVVDYTYSYHPSCNDKMIDVFNSIMSFNSKLITYNIHKAFFSVIEHKDSRSVMPLNEVDIKEFDDEMQSAFSKEFLSSSNSERNHLNRILNKCAGKFVKDQPYKDTSIQSAKKLIKTMENARKKTHKTIDRINIDECINISNRIIEYLEHE